MQKIILLCILLPLGLFLSPSCSKKGSSAPNCELSTIGSGTGSNTGLYNFTYTHDGNIATLQVTYGGSTFTNSYTYSGNVIKITPGNPAGYTDSIVLNSNHLMTYLLLRNANNTFSTISTYSYDSHGQLMTSSSQSNGTLMVTTYTYANGDLTTETSGGQTTSFSYYTDKPFADGDALKSAQLLTYGALFVKNAHLIKQFTDGSGSTTNYTYSFDGSGKITGYTASGGSTNQVTYLYNCK